MTRLVVFLFFWITMTLSLARGELVMFALLVPVFLLLYTEAESLEQKAPALTRQEPELGA